MGSNQLADAASIPLDDAEESEVARQAAGSLELLYWLIRLARETCQDGDVAPLDVPGLPRAFGRFRLERLLGRGAYAAVFQAIDTHIGKPVAIKIAWTSVLADAEQRQRFADESRALAAIRHRGIIEVYESGELDLVSFISMEFIDGPTLATWRKAQASVPENIAARIMRSVAEAVHAAHLAGIVHRDLKPANILLRPTDEPPGFEPVVTDFGLAKRELDASRSLHTATCAVVGTDRYMSPEQAAGRNDEVGPRSDIFSLGVIMYELLCGSCPFDGETAEQIRERLQAAEPAPLRRLHSGVSPELESIVGKCLEKSPGERYATASELADDLTRFLDGRPVHARPVTLRRRAWKVARRKPALIALASVMTIGALSVGGLLAAWNNERLAAARRVEADRRNAAVAGATARRNAYVSDIQLAAESLRLGKRRDVLELLDHARTTAGGADKCGIEWQLLDRLVNEFDRTWVAHPGGVCSVRFSPDGRRMYSAGKDGRVLVWDTQSWALEKDILVGDEEVHFAEPSSDGSTLAVACELGRVCVYRTGDWSKTLDEQVVEGRIFTVAWLGQDLRLAVGGTGAIVHVLDIATGERRTTEPLWAVSEEAAKNAVYAAEFDSMAYDPSRSQLFLGAQPRLQFSIDASSLKMLDARQHFGTLPGSICRIPLGNGLIAVARVDAVGIWNPELAGFVGEIPILDRVRALTCIEDGSELAIGYDNGAVECWNVAGILSGNAGAPRRLLAHHEQVLTLDISPDSSCLASGSADGRICLWRAPSFHAPMDVPFEGVIEAVKYSDCGKWLAVVEHRSDGTLRLVMSDAATQEVRWDAPMGRLSNKNSSGTPIDVGWPIAFCRTSQEVAVMEGDLVVRTRLVDSGRVTREMPVANRLPNMRLQFSPSGDFLIQRPCYGEGRLGSWWTQHSSGVLLASPRGANDGWVGSFHTTLGDLWLDQQPTREIILRRHDIPSAIQTLHGPTDDVYTNAISSDGALLVGGGVEGIVYGWDLIQGGRLTKYVGHHAPILDVCVAPDSRTILSLSNDGVVRLWDTTTGAALMKLGAPSERVVAMGLHPRGAKLVLAMEHDGAYGLKIHRFDQPLFPRGK